MPTELWGEGRVVGYSAYEIYVKQHLALNPDVKPATERQWLASSLASGASVLLKIAADTTSKSRAVTENWSADYTLPENSGELDYSLLCAANTIVGSFFVGTGGYQSGSVFAHKVTSYGNLIQNNSSSPATNGSVVNTSTYPTASDLEFSEAMQSSLKSYMKIVDGIVIQPGTWRGTGTTPARDMAPILSKSPTIRLHFRGPVKHTFELLLTGFSIRAVVAGESGVGGSVTEDTRFNKDGAFLGPGQYPWANKIVFSVPNAFEQYLRYNVYSRKLPTGDASRTPKGQPIIDMETTDPATYYSGTKTGFSVESSRQGIGVTKLNVVPEEADVLTVYQRNSNLPPAIYGSKVTVTGTQSIYPLDTIAPGTVKMYTSEASAKIHENNTPNNYSLYKNTTDNTVYHVKGSGSGASGVPIARQDSQAANYTHDSSAGTQTAQVVEVTTGDIKRRVLSMQDASGSNRTISSPPSSKYATNDDDLYWAAFLDILANDKKIDVLGSNLKDLKTALNSIVNSLQDGSENQYILNIKNNGGDISIELDPFSKTIEDDSGLGTYVTQTTVGNKTYKDISLRDTSHVDLSLRDVPIETLDYDNSSAEVMLNDGKEGTTWKVVNSSYISWKNLLRALKLNKVIDLLGVEMRKLKYLLSVERKTEGTKHVERFKLGADCEWQVDGSIIATPKANGEDMSEHTLYSGTNYIVFTDPSDADKQIRLYISNTQPTGNDIPVGSIGIGW